MKQPDERMTAAIGRAAERRMRDFNVQDFLLLRLRPHYYYDDYYDDDTDDDDDDYYH